MPAYFGLVIRVARPQLMMQEKHPRGRVRIFFVRDSPPTLSAVAKTPSRKFRVGSPPLSFRILIRTSVPYILSPPPPTGCFLIISVALTIVSRKAFASATRTAPVPRMATALRCFDPITAPMPVRPAARLHSFITLANRTILSPAGPMQATDASSSVAAQIASVVSGTDFPQISPALRISTAASLTQR